MDADTRYRGEDFIALSERTVLVIDTDGWGVTINPLHIVSVDDLTRAQ